MMQEVPPLASARIQLLKLFSTEWVDAKARMTSSSSGFEDDELIRLIVGRCRELAVVASSSEVLSELGRLLEVFALLLRAPGNRQTAVEKEEAHLMVLDVMHECLELGFLGAGDDGSALELVLHQACFALRQLSFHSEKVCRELLLSGSEEGRVKGLCQVLIRLLRDFPNRESHTRACALVRNISKNETTHEAFCVQWPHGDGPATSSVWEALAQGTRHHALNASSRDAWLEFFCMTVNLASHRPVALHASSELLGAAAGDLTLIDLTMMVLEDDSNLDDHELQSHGMYALGRIAFELPRVQERLMGEFQLGALDHILAQMTRHRDCLEAGLLVLSQCVYLINAASPAKARARALAVGPVLASLSLAEAGGAGSSSGGGDEEGTLTQSDGKGSWVNIREKGGSLAARGIAALANLMRNDPESKQVTPFQR